VPAWLRCGPVAAAEVLRAEILVARAVAHAVIDDRADRSGHRDGRCLGAASRLEKTLRETAAVVARDPEFKSVMDTLETPVVYKVAPE
jgi:hypothetical protein